jgi:hypothetical protein
MIVIPLKEEDTHGFIETYKVSFVCVHRYLSDFEEKAVEVLDEIKSDCIWW